MSTTTNFKRVALVAVAALSLGVLSAVPSQAVASGVTITATNASLTLDSGSTSAVDQDSTTAATIDVRGLVSSDNDTLSVTFYELSRPVGSYGANVKMGVLETLTAASYVAESAIGATLGEAERLSVEATESVAAGAAFLLRAGNNSLTSGNVGAKFALFLDSTTANIAGTYTYTVAVTAYSFKGNGLGWDQTLTSGTVSITVAANTADSTTPSAGFTVAYFGPTATPASNGTVSPALATASTVGAGFISVQLRNASNTAAVAKDTITVSIAGPGLIYDSSSYGKSLTGYQTGTKDYSIVPDGNAGTSTITVTTSRTGQTWTFSMVFYAATPATLTAAVLHPMLKIGSNASAVAVTAVDANKNNYAGTLYIYSSSAADALIAGTETPYSCSWTPSLSVHLCDVTGVTPGTAKFKVINKSTVALSTVTSNEVSVTVSNKTAATVKIAFNKATYAPNEKATVTVTVLDADGKVLPTATYATLFTSGGISASASLTGDTLTAVSVTTAASTSATTVGAGSAYAGTNANAMTYTVFMPSAGGTVTLTAKGGTSLPEAGQVAVTASAAVTDSAAAALAAVTALATTVASLRTLITTLTNLVLKIQKKVRA
jgi:hypothetical protein